MRNDEQNRIEFYNIKKDFMNKSNSEKGGKFLSQHKIVDSVYLRQNPIYQNRQYTLA